jgi:hypothetical protein
VESHSRDLSTLTSQPGKDGSKPSSTSKRTASRLRNDHYARITSRSTTSVGRTPFVTSQSHSPSRCDAVSSGALAGPWWQLRVVQHPCRWHPVAAHATDDVIDGSPRRPSAVPGRSDFDLVNRLCQQLQFQDQPLRNPNHPGFGRVHIARHAMEVLWASWS